MKSVYLAGPISGPTFDAAEGWRSEMRALLAPRIDCYSPLRQKHVLRAVGTLDADKSKDGYGTASPLATDRGILTRDHNDCQTADLIFVNFLGAKRVSIGTVMECAWAFAYRKPLVVAIEPAGNIHDHPMTREAFGFRVGSLSEGAAAILAILTPDALDTRKAPHPASEINPLFACPLCGAGRSARTVGEKCSRPNCQA